ncbi:hypothetical protein UFOVP155_2 [uncultured Caudovirales phage]|uniref:Uncharacterized protein n=1 Tax=uncultured Caudovirales phage TaxID=2100421 RepID=A0A6J7WBN6_9CAUD|nr:hypothetical protein UFOVP155_2 [uncultured Caudovirales phage]
MDDLVKRLRSPEVFIDTGGMISPVAYQAADRIEQLEAALREIAAASKIIAKGEDMETALKVMLASYQNIARAALGEKKDED